MTDPARCGKQGRSLPSLGEPDNLDRLPERENEMPYKNIEKAFQIAEMSNGVNVTLKPEELRGLLDENKRLWEALALVEWVYSGFYDYCPWCQGEKREGHKSFCPRQKALEGK